MEADGPEPPILPYRAQHGERTRRPAANIAAGITGFVLAAGAVIFVGFLIGINYFEHQLPGGVKGGILLGCGLLIVAGIIGLIKAFRSTGARGFVIGLLLGLCAACLMEGLCFANA